MNTLHKFKSFYFLAFALIITSGELLAQDVLLHGIPLNELERISINSCSDEKSCDKVDRVIEAPLKKMLKNRFKEYKKYHAVMLDGVKLMQKGDLFVTRGMATSSGGVRSSWAFFGKNGETLIFIKNDDKFEYFGDKRLFDTPEVLDEIDNMKMLEWDGAKYVEAKMDFVEGKTN